MRVRNSQLSKLFGEQYARNGKFCMAGFSVPQFVAGFWELARRTKTLKNGDVLFS